MNPGSAPVSRIPSPHGSRAAGTIRACRNRPPPPELPQGDPDKATERATGTRTDSTKTVLSWTFGCLFLLGGLTTPYLSVAVIWLAMGLVLVPPAAAKIEAWFGKQLTASTKGLVVISGLGLTVLLGLLTPEEDTSHYDKWIDRVGDIGGF